MPIAGSRDTMYNLPIENKDMQCHEKFDHLGRKIEEGDICTSTIQVVFLSTVCHTNRGVIPIFIYLLCEY